MSINQFIRHIIGSSCIGPSASQWVYWWGDTSVGLYLKLFPDPQYNFDFVKVVFEDEYKKITKF